MKRLLYKQDLTFLSHNPLFDAHAYKEASVKGHKVFTHMEKCAHTQEYAFLHNIFSIPDHGSLPFHKFYMMQHIIVIADHNTAVCLELLLSVRQSWVWQKDQVRISIIHDTDATLFWQLMSVCDPHHTAVVVISASGKNPAVLVPLMRCIEYWSGILPKNNIQNHFFLCTDDPQSPLGCISQMLSCSFSAYPTQTHHGLLGCFQPTLMWPLLLADVKLDQFHRGAALTCSQFFRGQLKIPFEGAGLFLCHHASEDFYTAYPVLQAFMEWSVAFSALKSVPYVTSAPQLWTIFLTHPGPEHGDRGFWKNYPTLHNCAQFSFSDVLHKKHRDFCEQHHAHNHMIRILEINAFNEETLGALVMNSILEHMILEAQKYPLL